VSSLKIPRTIEWVDGKVRILNQLKLPYKLEYIETSSYKRVIRAIKKMEIRGAPAIGVATAYGLALAVTKIRIKNLEKALKKLNSIAKEFMESRPTAYNLFWAVNKILDAAKTAKNVDDLKDIVVKKALEIARLDEECNRKIGEYGEKLIKDGGRVLTICNAGSLATSYYGTATAPMYRAWEKGKRFEVIVMETRPYLQGARLTAFELKQAGIPVKVITDNMIGIVMRKIKIDLVVTGADRVTKDGYVINKIGTFPLSLVAREFSVPFYVAAPFSTIDFNSTIDDVKIEERDPKEMLYIFGKRIVPEGVGGIYFAFDITPPDLVTGLITEKGIYKLPIKI